MWLVTTCGWQAAIKQRHAHLLPALWWLPFFTGCPNQGGAAGKTASLQEDVGLPAIYLSIPKQHPHVHALLQVLGPVLIPRDACLLLDMFKKGNIGHVQERRGWVPAGAGWLAQQGPAWA